MWDKNRQRRREGEKAEKERTARRRAESDVERRREGSCGRRRLDGGEKGRIIFEAEFAMTERWRRAGGGEAAAASPHRAKGLAKVAFIQTRLSVPESHISRKVGIFVNACRMTMHR